MTNYQYANWLYNETRSFHDKLWTELTKIEQEQWTRVAVLVQNDRKALAKKLRDGIDAIFAGLGHSGTQVIGVGDGFGKIKDVIRELDPKGPIT